jgi:RES domain-containing protein
MLEYFVHLDPDDAPEDLVLATAEVPADLPREQITADDLPRNWRETPAPPELARFGDEFVQRAKCCLLIVPSVVAGNENNWLLNPQHSDFQKIVFHDPEPLSYDPRMFGHEMATAKRRPRKHKSK